MQGGAEQGSIQGYEVDFMIDNFLNQYEFRSELGAAEGWLAGMHGAAQENNMSIQYCMALPSDLLASMAYVQPIAPTLTVCFLSTCTCCVLVVRLLSETLRLTGLDLPYLIRPVCRPRL